MKWQINKMSTWLKPPVWTAASKRKELLVTALSFSFWLLAVFSRPYLIRPYCGKIPEVCVRNAVPEIDRLSLGFEDWQADFYSFFLQNLSIVMAFMVPLIWNLFRNRNVEGEEKEQRLISTIGTDLLIMLETVGLNGLFTELSHLISQRARPFVYSDPISKGMDPAHYTSFYSGHTSFVAASQIAIFLTLMNRKASFGILVFYGILAELFIFSTAYFRILAGRHFLTDVLCGAVAGLIVAGIVRARFQVRHS